MRMAGLGVALFACLLAGTRGDAAQPADSRLVSELSRSLASGARVEIRDLALEDGQRVTLDLTRFEPFTADARLVVHGPTGDDVSPLKSDPYFAGQVAGDPDSWVLLAGGSSPRGFIVTGGRVTVITPETDAYRGEGGTPRLRTLDPELEVPDAMRSWRCGTESLPAVAEAVSARATQSVRRALTNTVYYASIAVETDYEFYAHFGSTSGARQYVADLFAAVSAIYLRDIKVVLQVNYLSLWTTSADPWNATGYLGALNELRSYWQANRGAVPRTTAHMLSTKNWGGGVAYLGTLCADYGGTYGYGVSGSLNGAFSITNPALYWDIMEVSHEIGHNFNSPHTPCYSPPVDMCYSGESGCYSGPTSVPPEKGTIMSYCHLRSGNFNNIKLFFGVAGEPSQAVTTRMRDYVESSVAACLGAVSGPQVTAISPAFGPVAGGTLVTVTGANFVAGATVSIGGVAATGAHVASATSLTAVTGARVSGVVDVLVKNPDKQAYTLPGSFTYLAPAAVTAIAPNYGSTSGSTHVTITGISFLTGATVSIGGVAASSVVVVNNTTITAVTEAHATGTVDVVVTNPGPAPVALAQSFFYEPPATASRFFTLAPCRVLDTRNPDGPYGGPILSGSGGRRTFVLGTRCGVPANAIAVSVNVTVTQPAAAGRLVCFPGNAVATGTSTISFRAGQTRANNAMFYLATDGTGSIQVENDSPGSAHFILDVNGYFR